MQRHLSIHAFVLTATLASLGVGAAAEGQRGLNDLQRQIAADHPDARSLTAEQFEARLAASADVVIFDVRDRAEFEVSRLPGAVLVEPHITAQEFIQRHGEDLAGKTVLLYCSVGVRSSALAQRIESSARTAGADGVFNLSGGAFSWHNTGRRLVADNGDTEKVHGYNRSWSRYVDFDNLVKLPHRWGW
jgi:rhodanese-related sulfurtransferase